MTADDEIEIDFSSIDFSDIEKKYAVEEPDAFSTIVIIDGAPVVNAEREARLVTVLQKIFGKFAKLRENGLHMPMVDDAKKPGQKTSKGFLFVDCLTEHDAKELVKNVDNYKLDKAHTLNATKFIDFERFMNVPEEYQPPKKEEYHEKEQLNSWLMDAGARDQYFAFAGDDVTVNWNNKSSEPDQVHKHHLWTDTYLQWSPMGTFVTTFHKQGVALWGGASWQRLVRFVHPNVKLIEFSPNETYLMTWSNEAVGGKDENLRIWDTRTGKLLRGFPVPNSKDLDWPFFKFSSDEKFVARPTAEGIAVYDLPDLQLVDGKVIKVENLRDFCWSPKDPIIAYWTPEIGNSPARVTLWDVVKRDLVRTKNLFMVNECKLYWQSEGDYLCVKVERYTKTKKTANSSLELFLLRQKDVPIEVYEEGLKDLTIQSIAWEPQGDRFGLFAKDGQKIIFGLYKIEKNLVKELLLTEKKTVNTMFWNPKGRFLVLAGLRNFQGELEFWDVDELQVLSTGEHFHATEVEWDPTGRYVTSTVSYWRHPTDTGYIIWDFKGQMLFKKNVERFKQLLWRPRPPSMLSKEQMKNIRRNLKGYSVRFDKADLHMGDAAARRVMEARQQVMDEWNAWRKACLARHEAQRDERARLRGGENEPIYSDDEDGEPESDEIEEWVEEVIEEKEEVVDESELDKE